MAEIDALASYSIRFVMHIARNLALISHVVDSGCHEGILLRILKISDSSESGCGLDGLQRKYISAPRTDEWRAMPMNHDA